ncbi:MAG: hypothetical protein K2Y21_06980 [Phycisphaerales bacterium]|nr:hypothetical protein [Phycisphaerales bacterium]
MAIAGGAERDPWAHRRGEPRTFAFLWSMFLMFAALVALGVVLTGGIVSLDAYQPLSRGLVVTIAVGVLIFWPLIRLSQDVPEEGSILAMLKDLAIVLIPVQAVVWPQMFLARWSLDTLTAMSLALTAWTLLTGAILVIALRTPNTRRSLWMLVCLVLAIGGLVGGIAAGISAIDPLRPREPKAAPAIVLASGVGLISDISADRAWSGSWALTMPQHWTAIKWTFVLAGLAWVPALAVGGRPAPRRSKTAEWGLDSLDPAGDQGNPEVSDAVHAPAAGLTVDTSQTPEENRDARG